MMVSARSLDIIASRRINFGGTLYGTWVGRNGTLNPNREGRANQTSYIVDLESFEETDDDLMEFYEERNIFLHWGLLR